MQDASIVESGNIRGKKSAVTGRDDSQTYKPGAMFTLPFVSVVMPVRNEVDFVQISLGAVLMQEYPEDKLEIVVADGMSTDGTREWLDRISSTTKNLRVVDNPGQIVATGLNRAIAVSKGDIVVRVDGHCKVARDYVKRCVDHILQDRVDGVGGSIRTIGDSPVARAIAVAMSSRFGVGGSAFRIASGKTMLADTVPFPAYTREIIEKAGAYDEELVRNQDDEYNYRLRKLGARILLAGDIATDYYSRTDLKHLWKQYYEYGYWKVRVLRKHPRQMSLRQFAPPGLVGAIASSLILTAAFSGVAFIFGTIVGLYISAVIIATLLKIREIGISSLPYLFAAYAILHFSYGTGFIVGLVKWVSSPGLSNHAATQREFKSL